MFIRAVALASLVAFAPFVRAQQIVENSDGEWLKPSAATAAAPDSAWLDLRQIESSHATTQAAPPWVESVSFVSKQRNPEAPAHSTFRIRINRPNEDCQILLFRLFFDDNPKTAPELIAWDESGSQVLRSGSLGEGTGLPTSVSTVVPMIGVTAIDLEVPGDGRSIRGAYLDWMKTTTVMSPIHADHPKLVAKQFETATPLKITTEDAELYGTVTAPLAHGTIPIGPSVKESASFQFDVESRPLVALLSFELASPQIDAAPEIYVNGTDLGVVSLVLPDLADPGYRGLSRSLLDDMKFQYTGWVRGQITIPGSVLKAGTNNVIMMAAAGTPRSALRGPQIQLKYLWDKADYLLLPVK
jgi:hypothetical protein